MLEGVLGIQTLKSIANLRFKRCFSKSWLILQFQNVIYGVRKNAVSSKITVPNTHIFAFLIKTRVKSFRTAYPNGLFISITEKAIYNTNF